MKITAISARLVDGGHEISATAFVPGNEVLDADDIAKLVDMMRARGVLEFQTADLHVVFREEVASAPDNQTTNDAPQPEARPRRYPGGRLVSVPTDHDQ